MTVYQGPTLPISKEIHQTKYRLEGEPFTDGVHRFSSTLSDNDKHRSALNDIVGNMRFLPAGRVQAAIGSPRRITPWNCFVSGTIADDFNDIMEKAKEAGHTMRLGGGIGYDFSTLRPRGSLIKSLGSQSSGPISFMSIYDTICGTIASAGHRRGAQMGVLRVDHPDIMEFIHAKRNDNQLTRFNISVGITDSFMDAVRRDTEYSLKFKGKTYNRLKARTVWDAIMRSNWDWGEPGVLFIDRINEWNNLYYCEQITATNPCLTEGTLVNTPSGYRKVEDLVKNDLILTLDGYKPITSIESHDNVETYEITFSNGIKLQATASHIFHSRTNTKVWSKETRLDQLNVGDKIRFHCINEFKNSLYDNDEYKEGLLNGSLLGDGSYTNPKKNAKMVFGKGETLWRDAFIKNFPGWCGKLYEDKTAFTLSILKLAPIVIPPEKSINKKIPLHLINRHNSFLRGLIDGYFSTDGNIHMNSYNPQIRATSRSRELLEGIQRILTRFGIRSSVYKCKKSNTKIFDREVNFTGPVFQISILGNNILKFYKEFELTNPYKQKRISQLKKDYSFGGDGDTTFVKEIKYIGLNTVYDIFEESTDTWVTEGIVNRGCGEQPLPPYGACLLGSFNLTKYVILDDTIPVFDYNLLMHDIPHVVRAMDNVIDVGIYPLPQQEEEGKSKRRMGLGVTGLANALEYLGYPYGSKKFMETTEYMLELLSTHVYYASSDLAKEKGSFPLFDRDRYINGKFIQTLDKGVQKSIYENGIRNSHLLSIAPTGTISLAADNISSGIEPVYSHEYERTIQEFDGPRTEVIQDYGYREWGIKGRTADEITAKEHVNVLTTAQRYVDSSVSKTCNVGDQVKWDDFKAIYFRAYEGGAKGCTTFRKAGLRKGILRSKDDERTELSNKQEYIDDEDFVCKIDEMTGQPTCS